MRDKAFLLAVVAAIVLITGCGRDESAREAHAEQGEHENHAEPVKEGVVSIEPTMLRDLRVTTAPVEVRTDAERVSLLGALGVNEGAYAEVGTPVAARVIRLRAAPGDRVSRGAALADLQSTELGQARAAAVQAASRLELAGKALERKRRLAAERIVPEREVQEAESEAAAARAEVEASRATLQSLGAGGTDGVASEFVLRAPLSGTVLERRAVQGQMVEPSVNLFRIADLSALWLTVHAFERDAVRIQVGAPAELSLPAYPGRTFLGTVSWIGREVDVTSRTIPVRIELPNPDGSLRPGMSATARVATGPTGGTILTVPAASLQRTADGWSVFIPQSVGRFEIRQVGRGRDLGGEVEVLSGLRGGETVVVEGAFLLKAEADKASGAGEDHEH